MVRSSLNHFFTRRRFFEIENDILEDSFSELLYFLLMKAELFPYD